MEELYTKSGAPSFGISRERFAEIVARVDPARAADVLLARACAEGNEAAWNQFVAIYRQKLNVFACSITPEHCAAADLADSLFGSLYGTARLHAYSGRGSLEAWLRAVLARDYIDLCRSRRRMVSYDAEVEAGTQFAAPLSSEGTTSDTAPPDPRLVRAFDLALESRSAEDRFLLAAYYLDERTLAAIASALNVHESTVSRRLERIRQDLRRAVVRALRKAGIDSRQAEELLSSDVRDLAFDIDLRRRLIGAPSGARR